MRFSSAITPKQPATADGAGVRAQALPVESPRAVPSVEAPWPADSPPDDLDQRVRQVGEWQLGDW